MKFEASLRSQTSSSFELSDIVESETFCSFNLNNKRRSFSLTLRKRQWSPGPSDKESECKSEPKKYKKTQEKQQINPKIPQFQIPSAEAEAEKSSPRQIPKEKNPPQHTENNKKIISGPVAKRFEIIEKKKARFGRKTDKSKLQLQTYIYHKY